MIESGVVCQLIAGSLAQRNLGTQSQKKCFYVESVLERLSPARLEFEALRLLRQLHASFLLRVAMWLVYIGNEW